MLGLATIGALAFLSRGRTRARTHVPWQPLQRCNFKIVLLEPDESSPLSKAVNQWTGGFGFSHAYLDACRVDRQGNPLVIDYQPGRGVHWARSSQYYHRRSASIVLHGRLGQEVFECVSSKLGEPFRILPLLRLRDSASNCSGLLIHCLPPSFRRFLQTQSARSCLMPNDLARLFGLSPGDELHLDSPQGETWAEYLSRLLS